MKRLSLILVLASIAAFLPAFSAAAATGSPSLVPAAARAVTVLNCVQGPNGSVCTATTTATTTRRRKAPRPAAPASDPGFLADFLNALFGFGASAPAPLLPQTSGNSCSSCGNPSGSQAASSPTAPRIPAAPSGPQVPQAPSAGADQKANVPDIYAGNPGEMSGSAPGPSGESGSSPFPYINTLVGSAEKTLSGMFGRTAPTPSASDLPGDAGAGSAQLSSPDTSGLSKLAPKPSALLDAANPQKDNFAPSEISASGLGRVPAGAPDFSNDSPLDPGTSPAQPNPAQKPPAAGSDRMSPIEIPLSDPFGQAYSPDVSSLQGGGAAPRPGNIPAAQPLQNPPAEQDNSPTPGPGRPAAGEPDLKAETPLLPEELETSVTTTPPQGIPENAVGKLISITPAAEGSLIRKEEWTDPESGEKYWYEMKTGPRGNVQDEKIFFEDGTVKELGAAELFGPNNPAAQACYCPPGGSAAGAIILAQAYGDCSCRSSVAGSDPLSDPSQLDSFFISDPGSQLSSTEGFFGSQPDFASADYSADYPSVDSLSSLDLNASAENSSSAPGSDQYFSSNYSYPDFTAVSALGSSSYDPLPDYSAPSAGAYSYASLSASSDFSASDSSSGRSAFSFLGSDETPAFGSEDYLLWTGPSGYVANSGPYTDGLGDSSGLFWDPGFESSSPSSFAGSSGSDFGGYQGFSGGSSYSSLGDGGFSGDYCALDPETGTCI